jgi:hypothetical protein
MNHTEATIPVVKASQLQPGDVLLYHGTAMLSRMIRLFDGTEYSHAGIWTGTNVVEALGSGVVKHGLKPSVAGSEYVHVYRFRDNAGNQLGSAGLPAQIVISGADRFAATGNRYAYEQILLIALLASTRRITAPIPFFGRLIRTMLDSATDVLARIAAAGKEPLICSELVFRCYDEAGAAYTINIRGADIAATFATGAMSMANSSAVEEDDGGLADAAADFLANYSVMKPVPAASANLGGSVMAVANFITPGDLSKSPNLQKLGKLSV